MRKITFLAGGSLLLIGVLMSTIQAGEQQWNIHDRNRPMAPLMTPGECSTQDHVGKPPSDATVLFDGKDLAKWSTADGGPAKWRVGDGYFEVVPGAGDMYTRDAFGDCQLHLEWATPNPPRGEDQDRGNSGVFLMGLYEVQVLDSYHSKTYADGQAAAIYGQYPPLVNACRPPGQWRAGAGSCPDHGPHRTQQATWLSADFREPADETSGPSSSCALPQHLDPGTRQESIVETMLE